MGTKCHRSLYPGPGVQCVALPTVPCSAAPDLLPTGQMLAQPAKWSPYPWPCAPANLTATKVRLHKGKSDSVAPPVKALSLASPCPGDRAQRREPPRPPQVPLSLQGEPFRMPPSTTPSRLSWMIARAPPSFWNVLLPPLSSSGSLMSLQFDVIVKARQGPLSPLGLCVSSMRLQDRRPAGSARGLHGHYSMTVSSREHRAAWPRAGPRK